MSQQQVLKILEKEEDWVNTKTIVLRLDLTINAVRRSLNQMYKFGEIDKMAMTNRARMGGDLWRAKENV